MSRHSETIGAAYFDDLYTADADPWGFRTSRYEADKYRATLAALSRPRYGTALEVGCSIGVFTAQLAPRCDHLLAIDGSGIAVAAAREACREVAVVRIEEGMVPRDFPAGRFDLIVVSEVLYYMTPSDLTVVAARCFEAQVAGGEILLCHWLGLTDYPLSGAEATDRFVTAALDAGYGAATLATDTYRLERLIRG